MSLILPGNPVFEANRNALRAGGRYAPTNLFTKTQAFDDAAWSKVGTTITADATTDPTGGSTADKMGMTVGTSGLKTMIRAAAVGIIAGATYAMSIFAKKAEKQYLQMVFDNGATTNGVFVNFDLDAGTISLAAQAYGDAVLNTAFIKPAGGGWFRCCLIGTAGTVAVTARTAFTIMQTGTSGLFSSSSGTAGDGLYLWGAQVEAGTVVNRYAAVN